MTTLETQWRASLTRLNRRELLLVFPEAESYLQERLVRLTRYQLIIEEWILTRLEGIKHHPDKWFWEDVIEITDGSLLEAIEKQIKNINLFFRTYNPKDITQDDIDNAKSYDFKRLLEEMGVEVKKDFIYCPFHEEKTPSLCIKKNYGYCFSCNWSCDTIKYLTEVHGMSFPEAVRRLN